MGISFLWGALWQSLCDPCMPCDQSKLCFIHQRFLFAFLCLCLSLNRSLTLYITYSRAKAVSNLQNAIKWLEMPVKTVIKRMALFVVPGNLLLMGFTGGLIFVMSHDVAFCLISSIFAIIMAAFAIYIFIKLRQLRKSVSRLPVEERRRSEDDFQRLITLVALVYCVSQSISAVMFGLIARSDDKSKAVQKYFIWSLIAAIANSGGNLFIYITASTSFYNALLDLF